MPLAVLSGGDKGVSAAEVTNGEQDEYPERAGEDEADEIDPLDIILVERGVPSCFRFRSTRLSYVNPALK